jgi:putative transposase
VNRLCQAAGVSRAGYYRFLRGVGAKKAAMDLRNAIQKIALEWPAYGYRRVHRELIRRGWVVNHKRVLRLMRMDNLLCLRKRKFVLTTDSKHGLPVYPNLAKDMVLTSINQLWVADITYIRLEAEFVYLAVLLDAFSRSCIGWSLQRSLETALVLEALRMALKQRHPAPGLVHHSDRGVQYATGEYTRLLEQHGIQISMSRKGNVYDNATMESFMKTLKYEEVYRMEYHDLEEGRASMKVFLEKIYNRKRLHSALGYRPPREFEQSLSTA